MGACLRSGGQPGPSRTDRKIADRDSRDRLHNPTRAPIVAEDQARTCSQQAFGEPRHTAIYFVIEATAIDFLALGNRDTDSATGERTLGIWLAKEGRGLGPHGCIARNV